MQIFAGLLRISASPPANQPLCYSVNKLYLLQLLSSSVLWCCCCALCFCSFEQPLHFATSVPPSICILYCCCCAPCFCSLEQLLHFLVSLFLFYMCCCCFYAADVLMKLLSSSVLRCIFAAVHHASGPLISCCILQLLSASDSVCSVAAEHLSYFILMLH